MTEQLNFPAANPTAMAVSGGGRPSVAEDQAPVLERVWFAISRYRLDIFVIFLLVMLGALLLTLLATAQYTATSRIEISRQQERVTNVEGVQPESAGQDLEFYQTQYSLLEARSLAERVVRAERLATDNAFFATFDVTLEEQGSGATTRVQRERLAVDILMANVAVNPVRNSALVDLSFTSPDPELSARIANAWVQQFIESAIARRFDSTADAREFLTTRLAELRERLEQSERDLVRYAALKNILPIEVTTNSDGRTSGQRTLASAELEALSAALAEATNSRIEAQARLSSGRGATAALEDSAALPGLRQRRAEVAAEYAKLRAQFEEGYPPVQSLRSQLASLDEAIEKEQGRVSNRLRSTYNEALAREQALRNQLKEKESSLYRQRSDSIQYNIYQREVDTNRELYEGLLQRYKEIGVAGVGTSNIAIVDQAEVPEAPSSPNLILNLALAFILGLGSALAYVFVREQIDQSVTNPAEISGLLGLPLLGPIPVAEGGDVSDALADPKTAVSEAYSSVATSLSFLTDHGIPRSILFTSTVANEGKSTSVYALAEIIARLGRRVIVVDSDMRNPTAHTFYGISNTRGLSTYLSGHAEANDLIHRTQSERVAVLPSGPTPPSTLELLSGDRLRNLIPVLNEQFDHILVDGPPVLGLADAPLISRVTEGVVLAVEANRVKARRIKDAISRVEASKSQFFGAILTKVDHRNPGYGYGYGYGYGNDQFKYGGGALQSDNA